MSIKPVSFSDESLKERNQLVGGWIKLTVAAVRNPLINYALTVEKTIELAIPMVQLKNSVSHLRDLALLERKIHAVLNSRNGSSYSYEAMIVMVSLARTFKFPIAEGRNQLTFTEIGQLEASLDRRTNFFVRSILQSFDQMKAISETLQFLKRYKGT